MATPHAFNALSTAVAVMALTVSCATMKHGDTPDRNIITSAEIESTNASTAYDVIARLHANFLSSRGPNSILLKEPRQPTVYLDQVEYGPINSLRSIPVSNIFEIRFIAGWDAMTKYGSDHAAGVIQIYTRYQ